MKKIYILLSFVILIQISSFAVPNSKEQFIKQLKSLKIATDKVKTFVSKPADRLKSTSASQQMLDKISYPDGSYKTFAYNNAGLLIDYKNYRYDSWDDKLELQEHQEIEYDKNGNETLFIDRNLDSFDGFIIIERREASYQSNNIPKEEIEWEYNEGTKTLERIVKRVYKSISDKNIVAESYGWDSGNNDWVLSGKSEFIFNDANQPLSSSSYNWSQKLGEYSLEGVLEFTYNAKGLQTEMVEKGINKDTGEMQTGLTTTSIYDANGNLLNEKAAGTFMGEEMTAYENIYTYKNGLMVSEEYVSVFGGTKTEYSYNNGKLAEKRDFYPDYDGNGNSKGLILQYKDQLTYDNSFLVSEIVYPSNLNKYYSAYSDFCDPFYFQFGALTNTVCFGWDYMTEAVIEKYTGTYHYSDFKAGLTEPTAINQLSEINMVVGPNPFYENLCFNTNHTYPVNVSVYNVNGKLIHKMLVSGCKMVDTSSWEKGIYMIHTQSIDSEQKVLKLIKK